MILENFFKIRTLRNDCNKTIDATVIQMPMKEIEDFNLN
jgi:hypothetical protein